MSMNSTRSQQMGIILFRYELEGKLTLQISFMFIGSYCIGVMPSIESFLGEDIINHQRTYLH